MINVLSKHHFNAVARNYKSNIPHFFVLNLLFFIYIYIPRVGSLTEHTSQVVENGNTVETVTGHA